MLWCMRRAIAANHGRHDSQPEELTPEDEAEDCGKRRCEGRAGSASKVAEDGFAVRRVGSISAMRSRITLFMLLASGRCEAQCGADADLCNGFVEFFCGIGAFGSDAHHTYVWRGLPVLRCGISHPCFDQALGFQPFNGGVKMLRWSIGVRSSARSAHRWLPP